MTVPSRLDPAEAAALRRVCDREQADYGLAEGIALVVLRELPHRDDLKSVAGVTHNRVTYARSLAWPLPPPQDARVEAAVWSFFRGD